MKRIALLIAQIAFAAVSVAQVVTPVEQTWLPDRQPAPKDPSGRSGWIRVEVAVLTDQRDDILNAETWPATPSVRYPGQWRWLTDLDQRAELMARYPGAAISEDERGAITVTLPPEPDVTEPVDDSDADVTPADPVSIDPLTGMAGQIPATESVPLESLKAAAPQPTASAEDTDWLAPFAAPQSLTDAVEQMQEENGAEASADTEVADDAASAPEPPPEPVPFLKRPTTLLAEGLERLTSQPHMRAEVQAAWVQPPGAKNLPIILDNSGSASVWPALQGFVELRRGSELRVGVNFWHNTSGNYLPAGFAMDPPPRAAQRVRVNQAAPQPLLNTDLGDELDLAAEPTFRIIDSDVSQQSTDVDYNVSYIDPATGMTVSGNPERDGDETNAGWPYRHLIAIADTRTVPENGVRYFDHPVVQVLVTWRELTWNEVWSLGEADAAAIADATPSSADEAARSSVVPPNLQDLQ